MTSAGALRLGPENPLVVRERGRGVRDLHERGLTWVSTAPLLGDSSTIAFAIRRLSGLGLIAGTLEGVQHVHHGREAGEWNDDFSIHLNLRGRSLVAGRRGEVDLGVGDAVLLNYADARRINRPGRVRYAIARVPRAALAPLVRGIDDAVMRRIPPGSGPLRLLTHYVGAVIDDPVLTAPDMQRLTLMHLCDLIAAVVNADRDAERIGEHGGLRAARLSAVKQDIEAHLTDSRLSPGTVAARQGISDSYIRKLFEHDGTTFSDFVLERRLACAYRSLSDPRRTGRSVASIAFDAGFGDLSYFNRTFRRRYGATPSEVRRNGQRDA